MTLKKSKQSTVGSCNRSMFLFEPWGIKSDVAHRLARDLYNNESATNQPDQSEKTQMISYKCNSCGNEHKHENDEITISGEYVILRKRASTCSCYAHHVIGSRHPLANLDQARREIEKQLAFLGIELKDEQMIDDFF